MAAAAATVKKVALELGGKNPNIVFADADLEVALDYALTAVFLHSGQVCSAGARLLVEESIHDAFVDALVDRAERIRLGGPFDEKAETGPLTSAAHRDKVEAYVAAGLAEGAVLRCGGGRPDDPALADGFYYLPTVLDGCTSDMSVTQDESFGPVLTVETFSDEDDAVRDRQRQHLRAGRRGVDPGRRQGPAGRGAGCGWARSGSTTTTPTSRRPSGAATSSPASAASSAWPASRSTARPSTSGTTSARASSAGSRARRQAAMGADRYDFVIVGGGSAGCALANRLSADRGTSVLVLEAGRSDWKIDPFIHMPAALPFPIGSRFYDWKYETDPEPDLGGRRVVPRPRQGARRLVAASTG